QDGFDDLVTLSRDEGGGVAVLWGGEDGGLARADGFNHRSAHRGLAVGDLDGDGAPEVFTSSRFSYCHAYRFWPERDDKWVGADSLGSLEVVGDVAVADVDRDGWPDIVAIAYIDYAEYNQMSVYVAYGREEPLRFGEWTRVAAVPELDKGGIAHGDV